MSTLKYTLIHPGNPDTAYALITHAGVYKTVDGGTSDWREVNNGLTVTNNTFNTKTGSIHPITFEPTILTATGGVFKTSDGGTNWVPKNTGFSDSLQVRVLERRLHNPDIQYAGTLAGELYITVDDADNWSLVNAGSPVATGITALVFDPADTNRMYVPSTNGDYYLSTDGGTTWTQQSSNIVGYTGMVSMAVDPDNANNFYMGGNAGVYRSTDQGTTWSFGGAGMGATVYGAAVNPNNQDIIYIASANGMWKTTDQGANWARINNGFPGATPYPSITDMAMDMTDPDIIYVSGYSATFGIYKTIDGGSNWVLSDSGITDKQIRALKYANHDTIYALSRHGLFKTEDGGGYWETVAGVDSTALSLAIDPQNSDNLYAGLLGPTQIQKSIDAGATWTDIAINDQDTTVICIAIAPSSPDIIFIGTRGSDNCMANVYRSTDAGLTWEIKSTGLPQLHDPPSWRYPANYYADQPLGINGIAIDPINPNIVYAAIIAEGGVYKTTDGGDTWNPMNDGYEGYPRTHGCFVDPTDRNTLYLTSAYGFWAYTTSDTLEPTPELKKAIAYANPARGNSVMFVYHLDASADVTIRVYNLAKELVASIAESKTAGDQGTRLDISEIPSGIYLYQITTEDAATGDIEHWERQKLAIIR